MDCQPRVLESELEPRNLRCCCHQAFEGLQFNQEMGLAFRRVPPFGLGRFELHYAHAIEPHAHTDLGLLAEGIRQFVVLKLSCHGKAVVVDDVQS